MEKGGSWMLVLTFLTEVSWDYLGVTGVKEVSTRSYPCCVANQTTQFGQQTGRGRVVGQMV